MMAQRTVAIAGASGHLGKHILTSFQSATFRSSFKNVVLLRRKDGAASDASDGDTVISRYYDQDSLSNALRGVDVLISCVGPAGHDFKDKLIRAMSQAKVKLYIPSEFGVDHTVHDFDHVEWGRKKHHFELVNKNLVDTKICRIFIGLFMEDSIGPWFGIDTRHGVYESIGSSDTPVTLTSLRDVGNVVAQVARMPFEEVPQTLHIGGDTLSWREIAKLMSEAGAGEIKMKETELDEYKRDTVHGKTSDPSRYLRFLAGEGKIEHTMKGLGNDNAIVNPGESVWKWKRTKDYAIETKGKPWADFEWNETSIS